MLSVILPAYNEQESIQIAADEVGCVLRSSGIEYELIFIDDGSKDDTWGEVLRCRKSDESVKGVRFSRNFGKEAAISAGLEEARGECCVVIDCDLQHPVAKIPEMYQRWEEGYEVVNGVKEERGEEGRIYRGLTRAFYSSIRKTSDIDIDMRSSDFKLLDRKVMDALNMQQERGTFFRGLSTWAGFKNCDVPYMVNERRRGTSKWSKAGLVGYALNNIASFSSAPMQAVTVLGLITLIVSVVFAAISLTQWILGEAIGGFTTVILLQLFMSSVIMISLGLIGYYIARIYDEVKGRSKFIVSERLS